MVIGFIKQIITNYKMTMNTSTTLCTKCNHYSYKMMGGGLQKIEQWRKQAMTEEKEIPIEIIELKFDIVTLQTIQALFIDWGYTDTAERLNGAIMSYNRLISKYYNLKYGEEEQDD